MNRSTALLIPVLLFTAALRLHADTPYLNFTKQNELKNIGMEVKLMPDSSEVPLPAPSVHTYRIEQRRGNSSRKWTEQRYSPLELWKFDQFAGMWVDQFRNRLLIARIKHPLPLGFKAQHVTREEYNAALEERKSGDWSQSDLNSWVASFTGARDAVPHKVRIRSFSIKEVVRYRLKGARKNIMAYTFKVKPPRTLRGRTPPRLLFARFDVHPSIDMQKARSRVEDKFLDSIEPTWSAESASGPSETFQKGSVSGKKRGSDKFQRSKQRVIAGIRNLNDWWYVETDDFIILSDLSTRYRVMIQDLQSELQLLRGAFEELIPATRRISDVSVIRVFGSEKQYTSYVGPRHTWTAGMWMPSRGELVVRPLTWGSSDRKREQFLSTIYHEALHQYVFYALGKVQTSPWFNEGHAVFFEDAHILSGRVEIEEDKKRVELLEEILAQDNLGKQLPYLFSLDYPDFYSSNNKLRRINYTLAWAVIYYLHKADNESIPPRVANILPAYLKALSKTGDMKKATGAVFGDDALTVFTKDFDDFWNSDLRRVRARRRKIFSD